MTNTKNQFLKNQLNYINLKNHNNYVTFSIYCMFIVKQYRYVNYYIISLVVKN